MEQNLTRREARENAFLAAFSATFHPDDPQPVLLNHAGGGGSWIEYDVTLPQLDQIHSAIAHLVQENN